MLKISVISRVLRTREITDISIHEINIFGIYRKQVNFLFIFSVKEKNLTFFLSHFSLFLLGSARLVGIILDVNAVCT